MHLYEAHVPVADTEMARDFYTGVVGLSFAYRDPTRDIVFLWAAEKKKGMVGLWEPNTGYGRQSGVDRKCHVAFAISPRSIVRCDKETEATRHRDVRVWWRQERRAGRNRLDAGSADLLSGSWRTHPRIHQHFTRGAASGSHWDLLAMERPVRGLFAKRTVINSGSMKIQSMTS
jgi:catechol 2,3-dioxygenase-like lactoylglutathione lyase family enzyme